MGKIKNGAGGIKRPGEDRDWGYARYEYAFLLRCEGLTFREIGKRLDVSGHRAQVLVRKMGRLITGAVRGSRWRIESGNNRPVDDR